MQQCPGRIRGQNDFDSFILLLSAILILETASCLETTLRQFLCLGLGLEVIYCLRDHSKTD